MKLFSRLLVARSHSQNFSLGHVRVVTFVAVMCALCPFARSASPEDEIKQCSAGSILDKVCMQKHEARFEKYVIEDRGSYLGKSFVSGVLVKFYDQAGIAETEQARKVRVKVRAKNAAFTQANAIGEQISRSHFICDQDCLDGKNHGFFVGDMNDIRREQALAIRQYFFGLDVDLYKGELKYLDSMIKIYSRR